METQLTKKDRIDFMIRALAVMNDGYVKPDVHSTDPDNNNNTGVTRDTKKYYTHMDKLADSIIEELILTKKIEKRKL